MCMFYDYLFYIVQLIQPFGCKNPIDDDELFICLRKTVDDIVIHNTAQNNPHDLHVYPTAIGD